MVKLYTLRSYFDETVPIVPALGNHDTSPPDQYPDPKIDKAASLTWYSAYIEQGSWGDLIPKASQDDFKKCGFYAYPLGAKVKFIYFLCVYFICLLLFVCLSPGQGPGAEQ